MSTFAVKIVFSCRKKVSYELIFPIFCALCIKAELRLPEGPPNGAPYSSCKRKGNPWVDFLMVVMASGMARGCVHTTTTTESRNMVAIPKKRGWQRHTALVYCALFWYWTTMLRSGDTCHCKVFADQYHMAISWAQVYSSSRSGVFFKLTADQVLVFPLDRGLMLG